MDMEVSGLRLSQARVYSAAEGTSGKGGAVETAEAVSKDTDAATFEADGGVSGRGSSVTVYKMDVETVRQLKSESEQRMANLVKKMLGQQLGDGVNIWEKLRTGDFQVDEETIRQAQADIAEDGYWGVEQTSDRIVQYATALTGGDPDKLDAMIDAFEKGFSEAEKEWGDKLPDISQRTREAVRKKFQDLKEQYANGGNAPAAQAAQASLEAAAQRAMDQA